MSALQELPTPFDIDPRTDSRVVEPFQSIILSYYQSDGRAFPWRDTDNPYYILLSEMMLQQTQTQRVLPKYTAWIEQFPTWKTLAEAPLLDVLAAWKGLGYNRRAKAIHSIAKKVIDLGGDLPRSEKELLELPMVGPATAAAIGAFCYNEKTIYLETNIRRVLIYFFFSQEEAVQDKDLREILQILVQTVPSREWYYALMDYGVMLKSKMVNPNRRSAHYTKQSKFEGSHRQIRGAILHLLIEAGSQHKEKLYTAIDREPDAIDKAMEELVNEGFVACEKGSVYRIS